LLVRSTTSLLDNNLRPEKGQGLSAAPGDGTPVAQGGFSLSEAVAVWLNSLYLSISSQSEKKYTRKVARFLVRGFRGVGVGLARGYRFRWFVLTESNEAIEADLDFGKQFHKLVMWLRYYCSDFQYLVVEHRKPRRHWHLITYGSDKLPCEAIRSWWLGHYYSTISGMAEIRDIEKAMYYVSGYLKRGGKLARCWCSYNWVFPGWLGFSREYYRKYGEYPKGETLVSLSLMAGSRRKDELQWLIETGELSGLYLVGEVGDNGKV
jgi:hypothetical protein